MLRRPGEDAGGSIAGCTALIDGGKLSKDKLATAYANRCLVHTQRNESDLAIADCTQAIAIDPGNALAYAQRGEANCQKGDIKNCVADFDEAMRIDPSDPSFVYLRGMARADAGDADGAIGDYEGDRERSWDRRGLRAPRPHL